MTVYLGCYTDSTHPNGLKVLELDEFSGAMSVRAGYPVSNALYQALSPDGTILYSCTGEGLAAFEVTGNWEQVTGNGWLRKIDAVKLGNSKKTAPAPKKTFWQKVKAFFGR